MPVKSNSAFAACVHTWANKRFLESFALHAVEGNGPVEDVKDAAFASMVCVAKFRRHLFCVENCPKSPCDRFQEDSNGQENDDDENDESDLDCWRDNFVAVAVA